MQDNQTHNQEKEKKWFFDYFFDPDELPKFHFISKQIQHKDIESYLYNWMEFKNKKDYYIEIEAPLIKDSPDPYQEYKFDRDNNVIRISNIINWKIKKIQYPLIPHEILSNLPEKWVLYQTNLYWEITSIYEIVEKKIWKIFVRKTQNEI